MECARAERNVLCAVKMRPALVSFALHAAAFILLLRVAPRSLPPAASLEMEPPTIEIVDDESTAPAPSGAGPAAVAAAPAPATIGAIGTIARSATPARIETSETAAPPASAGPAESAAAPAATITVVPLTTAELGIGEKNPFLPSSPAALAANETKEGGERARPAAERALKDALRERDRSIGLTNDGPVLVALKDATSTSLAPANGRAIFTVRADAQGLVLGIDLEQASGGSGWDDARKRALEGLRGKKLPVPSGARGVNVRVEVVSDVSFASGQKSATELGVRDGALVLPDESNIGAKRTRKIYARTLGAEVL
jgi:hypothetical protein